MEKKPLQIIEEHLITESFTVKKSIYNFWERTLTIIFDDQSIQRHLDVDVDTFEKYKNNESKDTAYQMYIKDNFKSEKIVSWKI